MFNKTKNQLDHEVTIVNGKRLHQTYSIEYLCVYLDKYLSWKHQIDDAAIKLNKANAMLSKIRHYIDIKTIYVKSLHIL